MYISHSNKHGHNSSESLKKCKECCEERKKWTPCENCSEPCPKDLCSFCSTLEKCECGNVKRKSSLKHCEYCFYTVENCSLDNCQRERLKNSYFCEKHSCKNCLNICSSFSEYCSNCECDVQSCSRKKEGKYCEEHTCKRCGKYKSYNEEYCRFCVCGHEERIGKYEYQKCVKFVKEGFSYCEEHFCPIPKCQNSWTCEDHTCSMMGSCTSLPKEGSEFCEKHTCKECNEPVREYRDYPRNSYGQYCEKHTCNICRRKKYTGNFCKIHSCCFSSCEYADKRYKNFFCNFHNDNKRNRRKDELNHLQKMDFSKLDWNIVKAQISEHYPEFWTYFKKLSKSYLISATLYKVPKDVRKMMIQPFLEKTISHYFKKKTYKNWEICSLEDCGHNWPYDKSCEKHSCEYCDDPKKKGSDFCKEHTCYVCVEPVYTPYNVPTNACRKHLCPLCMERGAGLKKKFCKKCRCEFLRRVDGKKWRCQNPKSGNKYCKIHT